MYGALSSPYLENAQPLLGDSVRPFDVAIVGAGPVGSLCALAHAQQGQHVALFERNTKAATRLAGEWLHPPAVALLKQHDISVSHPEQTSVGEGFVVYPEDGSEPIMLPYPDESRAMIYEHAELVSDLHLALSEQPNVSFFKRERIRSVEAKCVSLVKQGEELKIPAKRVVGADGRSSVVRQSIGPRNRRLICSRMVGVLLEGVALPVENYGHVMLGAPGPVFMFHLGPERVRIILDVPLNLWNPRERIGLLLDSYLPVIPDSVRPAFTEAICSGQMQVAGNEIRPRVTYGESDRILIGDAAGHYHPLTAVGLTLGFGDASSLATCSSCEEFTKKRFESIRAPEFLAMGLYEVFSDYREEAALVRQSVYHYWRRNRALRDRTMSLLACENVSVTSLGFTFFRVIGRTIIGTLPLSFREIEWRRAREVTRALSARIYHFFRGALSTRRRGSSSEEGEALVRKHLSRAFLESMQGVNAEAKKPEPVELKTETLNRSLNLAADCLVSKQLESGAWEGEMVWCPMLTAQYVLFHHVIDRPLPTRRSQLILKQFEESKLDGGCWGLHEQSEPYLFVTTLVYVAARILGVRQDDPLIAHAKHFIQAEGVENIPSWGKFWLALLNLFDWEGLNPVLPELWKLPDWLPIHPSKWYCHTRLIYMAMASIYATSHQVKESELVQSIREELYDGRFSQVKFRSKRNKLRKADLFESPSNWLRLGYIFAGAYERIHSRRLRTKTTTDLLKRIKWELNSSSHMSISPVSGFLNLISLWLSDPSDKDFEAGYRKVNDWIWEDESKGIRVTGARSASWDTAFAIQALSTVPASREIEHSIERAAGFLKTQQIQDSFEGFENAYRNNPKGGWCFAGVWHGWPVTDCTAEAVLGLLASDSESVDTAALKEAIEFMLRGQNRDGGFGSYESQRSATGLEWMNPAEMFGESMTEKSYVECTSSCLAVVTACRQKFPELIDNRIEKAISKAKGWLQHTQQSDGSWRGVWGVQFIYGTFFGIRGLLAAGVPASDPSIRLACRWLIDRQLADGGWGEHASGCKTGQYVEDERSQVIQTAWSLIALLEATDPDWIAITNGIKYLTEHQKPDGSWPKQAMAGVFFRTALLDYVLYRQYFPLHALGLYEQRLRIRCERSDSKFVSIGDLPISSD